jgi:hypothetical protein
MKNFWNEIKLWNKRWDYKLTVFSKNGCPFNFWSLFKMTSLLCLGLVLLYNLNKCF